MIKKNSYERRVYESVDDNSLSKAISQKTDEKNKSCNKGIKEFTPKHLVTFNISRSRIRMKFYFVYSLNRL